MRYGQEITNKKWHSATAASLVLTSWSYTDYQWLRGQFSTIRTRRTVTCSPLHTAISTRWLRTITLPATLVTQFAHIIA